MSEWDRFERVSPKDDWDRFERAAQPTNRSNPLLADGINLLGEIAAVASGGADSLTFGFGDEILGNVAGVGAALTGGDFGRTRDLVTAQARVQQDDLRNRYGGAFTAGGLAGGVLPFFGPGAAVVRNTVGRLPGATPFWRWATDPGAGAARAITSAGVLGAGFGALGGAGRADENDRFQGAIEGAGIGAIAGGAFAGGAQALGPLLGKSRGMVQAINAGRPADQRVSNAALDDLARTLARSGMSAGELSKAVDDVLTTDPGRGRVLMDMLGVEGVKVSKGLTKNTGKTAQLAEDILRVRNEGALDRLEREVLSSVPGMSAFDATAEVARLYETTGRKLYAPLFKTSATPGNTQAFKDFTQRFDGDPVFARAMQRGQATLLRERALNMVEPDADQLRLLAHYTKLGLDDELSQLARRMDGGGLGPNELRAVTNMKNSYLAALEKLMPGYSAARREWGGLVAAEEAIDMGRGAFSTKISPEQLRQYVQRLTPFQKDFFNAGLKTEMMRILRSGDVDGRRNIADALLRGSRVSALRQALGSDEFGRLQKALRTESELFRNANAARALSGSDTGIFASQMGDQMVYAPRDPGGVPFHLAAKAWREIFGPVGESRRDALGRLLFTSVDDPTQTERTRGLLRALSERYAERQKQMIASQIGAVQGGM